MQVRTPVGLFLVAAFQLTGAPLPGEIVVIAGGTTLSPSEWSYDPTTNSITIDSSLVTLIVGEQVVISYGLICN